MTMLDNNKRQNQDLCSQPEAWWRQLLFLGLIGIELLLLVSPNAWQRFSTAKLESSLSQRVPAKTPAHTQRAPSLGPTDSSFASRRLRPGLGLEDPWLAGRRAESSAPSTEPVQHVWELDVLVSKVKAMKEITAEDVGEIKRLLYQLRKQGAAAVLAIRDFLRQGEDVNFTKISGEKLVGQRTLRQALIDTLQKIGGSEATAVSLEQVRQTKDPIEMAMLVRGLEKAEPGIHGGEVIQAISNVLQWAELAPAKESPDVSPLFEILRTYGGEQAVAVLERSVPQWGEYALIALAGLPEGAGIPSLTALAGTPNAPVANPALPFQILAQSTVHYPEAGDALVNLARAGQIPDQAWRAMGETLGGKSLRFSGKMFDGTPLAKDSTMGSGERTPRWKNYYIEWLNIRYEQELTSASWSAKQIHQQVALIDDLLRTTSTPAAVRALQQARESLQGGRRVGMKQ